MNVRQRLESIQEEIKAAKERVNRTNDDVSIIAVTKYVSVERASEAIEAGIVHVGENRLEGLLEKKQTLQHKDVKWHFIGTLQTRKVKDVLPHVDYIHSLDRLSLAKEIEKRADRPVACFLQVKTSNEETKQGCEASDVISFVQQLREYEHVHIVGLMTMAPFTENEDEIRRCFKLLKQLQIEVQQLQQENAPCKELSMGMSNDFTIAIEEGATFLRIGSSLVGD